MTPTERYIGCLIGTAVGDSLLLPAEGLSRRRIARRFGDRLSQGLVLGRGMVSDDTDHTFLVARCLAVHRTDAQRFARRLAWRLRWWLLCVPAGCGKATGHAIIKLLLGWSPERSGVSSGGNGPSMRAAIIGAVHAHDQATRHAIGDAACRLTHNHPHAHAAARAVAEVAAWIARGLDEPLWPLLDHPDPEWRKRLEIVQHWHASSDDTDVLAITLGCPERVWGWSLTSVPFALGCWLRHRHDPRAGLTAIRRAGGDTDTIGAIAGAWYGVDDGEAGFPAEWVRRIADWPVSAGALRAAGAALDGAAPLRWAWPLLPLRNAVFFLVILLHLVRRMFP
jgi:ADP-ribosyl-[dinitrogen reductase] hydrolase